MPDLVAPPERPPAPGSLALVVLAYSLTVVIGCNSSAGSASTQPQPLATIEAELLTIQPRQWPTIVRCQGSLMADEVTVVGAKVGGAVAEVHVDLGDEADAAQPLVTLEQEDLRLQVDQAEAQLTQARSAVGLRPDEPVGQLQPHKSPPVRQEEALWNEAKASLERAQELQRGNLITEAQFGQTVAAERVAEARYSAALNSVREKIALIGVRQADLSLVREHLRDSVICAPFAGLVQQRQVAPGTYVQIGDPLVTLVRTNPLRFRGAIPERHAQSLAIGQPVRLRIESVDEPRTVRVTRISPTLDRFTRSLLFEADVDNSEGQLRSGVFAEAEIVVDTQAEALFVPHSAVVEFAGAEKIWKVVDGTAVEQEVLLGARRSIGIEVLAGLAAGDVIMVEGTKGRLANVQPLGGPADDRRPGQQE